MTRRSAPPLALGVDAGGTGTRWHLRDATGPRAHGELGPLSGLSFLAGVDPEATVRLAELARAVRASSRGELRAVVAGVTGLEEGDEAAERVRAALAIALTVDASQVRVLSDVVLAYHGAFDPGEGALVYGGTGAMGIHLTHDHTTIRVGGHGYLIDDAGGGFWIGRQALRLVLRNADARGAPAEGRLADELYGALGGHDWPTVRSYVYGGGRRAVARLVPAVGRALHAGDADAAAIVEASGAELGRLGRVLLGRVGRSVPLALAGGVTRLGEPLRRAVMNALPAGAALWQAHTPGEEAAARMAQHQLKRD